MLTPSAICLQPLPSSLGVRWQAPNFVAKPRAAIGAHMSQRAIDVAGTRGIGKQLVTELRKRGASVICLARGAPSAADAVDGVDYRSCDISAPADVKATLADVKTKYGYLDIVVNNAGCVCNCVHSASSADGRGPLPSTQFTLAVAHARRAASCRESSWTRWP